MAATHNDIRRWIAEAQEQGARYLIVAVDMWDYENYPIFCEDEVECWKQYESHNGKNMQRVDEVYDLNRNIEDQLCSGRARSLPPEEYRLHI